MEPDDIPVHDLLGVGGGPKPGPDDLRAIVARAGRYRLRLAGAGMAATLLVGGVVGYAISGHSSPNQTAVTPAAGSHGQKDTSGHTPAAAPTPSAGISSAAEAAPSTKYTHLFTRTAGPVTIRGFLTNATVPSGGAAGCDFGPSSFQAEVSTSQMVGVASSGFDLSASTGALSMVGSDLVGTAEADPVAVVAARTGSGVAEVRMSFAGGAVDQMAPVGGWVALAAPVSSKLSFGQSLGTLIALNSKGATLNSTALTLGSDGLAPGICVPTCGPALPRQAKPLPGAVGGGGGAASSVTSIAPPSHPGSSSTTVVVNPGGPMVTAPAAESGPDSTGSSVCSNGALPIASPATSSVGSLAPAPPPTTPSATSGGSTVAGG